MMTEGRILSNPERQFEMAIVESDRRASISSYADALPVIGQYMPKRAQQKRSRLWWAWDGSHPTGSIDNLAGG